MTSNPIPEEESASKREQSPKDEVIREALEDIEKGREQDRYLEVNREAWRHLRKT